MTSSPSSQSLQSPLQSTLERLTIFLFFLGVALSVTHRLWAYDVWWHLKTGEWIWTHRAIPKTDLYSYTVPNNAWIDLSWGFQLLIYLWYSLLGIKGIILFKVAIVTSTFFLLFRFFYRKLDLLLLFPTLSLTLMTTHERLVERPEVLSYFFLVAHLLILEKDRLKSTRLIYVLPFLQIFWVNCHGLFALGLFVIGIRCLGDTVSWRLSRERVSFPKRLYLLFALSFLATFVNPYGLKGVLFPLTLFSRISGEIEIFTLGIGEFTRPLAGYDSSYTLFFYKISLFLALFSFVLNHGRFSFFHGILFFLFAVLSFLARRNIAPFAFVACFLTLKNIEDFLQKGLSFPKFKRILSFLCQNKPLREGLLFSSVLFFPVFFMSNAFYEHEGNNKQFGLGISEHRYPIEAANFIERHNLRGNFFNSTLDAGNYLIWRFYPERKVFMDGRLEVYGESFFKELFVLFQAPSLWTKWVEKYQINFCILDHTSRKQEVLLRWIYHDPEWKPVYLDEQAIIFLKDTLENRAILKTYSMDLVNDPIPSQAKDTTTELRLADFYAKIGLFDKAEVLYRKNLSPLNPNAAIYHNLGILFRSQGENKEALSAYRKAITLQPKNYLFHYSLGFFLLEMTHDDEAQKEFLQSVRLSPNFGETHYQLGRLYEKRGGLGEAEKEYLLVSSSDAAYLSARNALGILYAEKGEFEKAEKEFRDILKVNPSASGTFENLKQLEKLKGK